MELSVCNSQSYIYLALLGRSTVLTNTRKPRYSRIEYQAKAYINIGEIIGKNYNLEKAVCAVFISIATVG